MKVVVLINKNQPSLELLKINEASLSDAFNFAGIAAEIHFTYCDQFPGIIKRALSENTDAVIAGGGDGTVSAVSGLLAGGQIPLAVLPLGTLNHFAKDIGMPLNYQEAIKEIKGGEITTIDLAEVNGHIFINNSSIGLYPKIVKTRDIERKKRGINKWLAMFFSAMKVLTWFPTYEVNLETNNTNIKCKTPFVFVGNNEYEIELFNPVMRPTLSGGKLSLYVSCTNNKLGFFRFACLFLLKKLDKVKDFNHLNSEQLWIGMKKKRVEVSADGEVFFLEPPLYYKIRPKYLKVIVPAKKDS